MYRMVADGTGGNKNYKGMLDYSRPALYDKALKTRLSHWILPVFTLIAAIALLCAGQLLAKQGARLRTAGSDAFWIFAAAYCCYLLRAGAWVLTLRRLPLSLAYPLLASAYPLIMLLSALFFDEPAGAGRILASVLIGGGVILLGIGGRESDGR